MPEQVEIKPTLGGLAHKRVTRNSLRSSVLDKPKTVQNKKAFTIKTDSKAVINKRKADDSPKNDKPLKRGVFNNILNAVEEKENNGAKKILKKTSTAVTRRPISNNGTTRLRNVENQTVVKTNIGHQPVLKKTVPTKTFASNKTNTLSHTITQNKPSAITGASKASIAIRKKLTSVKEDISVKKDTSVKEVKDDKIKIPVVIAKPIDDALKDTKKEETQPDKKTEPSPLAVPIQSNRPVTRRYSKSLGSDTSLYVTAFEELNLTDKGVLATCRTGTKPPDGVDDFDYENINDPFQLPEYAFDIFEYLKSRERLYAIDHAKVQGVVGKYRAILVDWMVDVQENFELIHETLYLAVKIMDMYFSKGTSTHKDYQLVAATAILISSKYEERSAPLMEDMVYMTDNTYTVDEVKEMEVKMLKAINFDLGFPLSYRFLRRYGMVTKTPMPLLTLARFILEYSLMDIISINTPDSKLAAAALHIARVMDNVGGWNATLEYYSGYKLSDFIDTACQLNDIIHQKPKSTLKTIRDKYSHEVFFKVATKPLVKNDTLKL